MRSLLVRTILSTMCGLILILIALYAYDWYRYEYPKPLKSPIKIDSVQFPVYHEVAVRALNSFSRLPDSERKSILQNLKNSIISLEDWLNQLQEREYEILCCGEYHDENTRQFLSDKIFGNIHPDYVFLEATPKELNRVLKKMKSGRKYFPLLGADILNVLHALLDSNSETQIYPIEETEEQKRRAKGRGRSRDRSLSQNFWKHFRPGEQHVILVGGLHCSKEPNWLYGRLWEQASDHLKQRMLNVWVLAEHQTGSLESFIYFCDGIGIEFDNFVISGSDSLDPRLLNWFHVMNQQLLQPYDALVVFRDLPR